MSLDKALAEAVKSALQDYAAVRPVMVSKQTLSQILDVSVDVIDKMIKERVLIEEVHFTRMRKGGHISFYVPEVIATVKPKRSTEKVL